MPDLDISQLAACSGAELAAALDAPLAAYRGDARSAGLAVTALASNPHLSYEQFEKLIADGIGRWMPYGSWVDKRDGRQVCIDAEFQVPAHAPGERAAEWWHRLALQPVLMNPRCTSDLLRWRIEWVLRRALVTGGPDRWGALWTSSGPADMVAAVRDVLPALVQQRLGEPGGAVGLTYDELRAFAGAWVSPWQTLRRGLPARSTRDRAARALAVMSHAGEAARAELAVSLSAAVLESMLTGDVRFGYRSPSLGLALLTPTDQERLLDAAGSCPREAPDTWVLDSARHAKPFAEVYVGALSLFPVSEHAASRHLTCPAPRHRIALAQNPACPKQVAVAALRRGIQEADNLFTTGAGLPLEGGDSLIETWWQTLMAARGWFAAAEIETAMQRVVDWMLGSKRSIRFFWQLAVSASQPDGLECMTAAQRAAYDVWLAELSGTKLDIHDRRRLSPDPAVVAATTAPVLLTAVAATGGVASPVLTGRGILAALPALPAELRVGVAREGGDPAHAVLLDDPDRRVRQQVGRSARLTEHVFARLAADSDAAVRSQVARNTSATTVMLTALATDPDPAVRAAVARSRGVTAQLLTQLAADSAPKVAQAAGMALLKRLAAAG